MVLRIRQHLSLLLVVTIATSWFVLPISSIRAETRPVTVDPVVTEEDEEPAAPSAPAGAASVSRTTARSAASAGRESTLTPAATLFSTGTALASYLTGIASIGFWKLNERIISHRFKYHNPIDRPNETVYEIQYKLADKKGYLNCAESGTLEPGGICAANAESFSLNKDNKYTQEVQLYSPTSNLFSPLGDTQYLIVLGDAVYGLFVPHGDLFRRAENSPSIRSLTDSPRLQYLHSVNCVVNYNYNNTSLSLSDGRRSNSEPPKNKSIFQSTNPGEPTGARKINECRRHVFANPTIGAGNLPTATFDILRSWMIYTGQLKLQDDTNQETSPKAPVLIINEGGTLPFTITARLKYVRGTTKTLFHNNYFVFKLENLPANLPPVFNKEDIYLVLDMGGNVAWVDGSKKTNNAGIFNDNNDFFDNNVIVGQFHPDKLLSHLRVNNEEYKKTLTRRVYNEPTSVDLSELAIGASEIICDPNGIVKYKSTNKRYDDPYYVALHGFERNMPTEKFKRCINADQDGWLKTWGVQFNFISAEGLGGPCGKTVQWYEVTKWLSEGLGQSLCRSLYLIAGWATAYARYSIEFTLIAAGLNVPTDKSAAVKVEKEKTTTDAKTSNANE